MILKKSNINRLILIITLLEYCLADRILNLVRSASSIGTVCLLCSVVYSKLDVRQIEQSLKDLNFDIKLSSDENPISGFLFESTGTLYNLRFYSPSLKYGMNNGKRVYADDTSDDPFIKSVIMLFPSHTGILSHEHAAKDSFITKFKSFDKKKCIEFLAKLVVGIKNDKPIDYRKKRMSI